jgi:FMN-dependent oxidoreductase (nitrilotriacetate monooxygenase family)
MTGVQRSIQYASIYWNVGCGHNNPGVRLGQREILGDSRKRIAVRLFARNRALPKKMHLTFDISYIHMDGRWRLPGSWIGRTFPDVEMYEEMARIAERGCLDMIFFGDGTGIPSTWRDSHDEAVHWGITWPRQDMSPMITAMSRVTRHVGFGLTYASTFMHPYYVARLLNSLDHITNGRVAFNVITSTRRADAANFGFDELMEHAARYDRMDEFMQVCRALWDSVAPDAMVWNHETGQVGDPTKVRAIDHVGKYFKVKGPLNTPPSPQGHPPIIQAGGSPRGIKSAARVADVAFGTNLPLGLAVKQRQEFDAALREVGRDPETVGIVWQTPTIVAETQAAAHAQRELMLTMIPMEGVGAYLSHNIAYDFSKLPDRFTLLELNDTIVAAGGPPASFVHELAHVIGEKTEITRKEFFEYGMRAATLYDSTVCGTPAQVADRLEEIFEATGSRGGFMLGHPIISPGDLIAYVDLLVPELRRRGRFRKEYTGKTLRENLLGDD